MKLLPVALLACTSLTACETLGPKAPDIVLDAAEHDDAEFVEAIYLGDESVTVEEIAEPEPLVARTFGPALTPDRIVDAAAPAERPDRAIDAANASAAVEPRSENYLNAIQIYPYARGALYQVYTAPEQVTDIALEPGEELVSVSAGDTARWMLGDTVSGRGDTAQVHVLVKPIQSGLKTNLIITTSRRTYHLELHAFNETYMAAVSWRYPETPLVRRSVNGGATSDPTVSPAGLQLHRLRFRYEITGDEPHWRPVRVFDDGQKVYIQFPERLDQGEAPPLFVIGRDGRFQLVNYRMREHYYVVDRLFAMAELRLGERNQDVVRITRTDLGGEGA